MRVVWKKYAEFDVKDFVVNFTAVPVVKDEGAATFSLSSKGLGMAHFSV